MPTDSIRQLTLSDNYTLGTTFYLRWPIRKINFNVSVSGCIVQVADNPSMDFPYSPQKEMTILVGYTSKLYIAIYGFRLKNLIAGTNSLVDIEWIG